MKYKIILYFWKKKVTSRPRMKLRSMILSFYNKKDSFSPHFWDPTYIMNNLGEACEKLKKNSLDILWLRGLPVDPFPKNTAWGESFLIHLGSRLGKGNDITLSFPMVSPLNDKNFGLYCSRDRESIPDYVGYFFNSLGRHDAPSTTQLVPCNHVLHHVDTSSRTILKKPFYRFGEQGWTSIINKNNELHMFDPIQFPLETRNLESMNRYLRVRKLTSQLGVPLFNAPGDLLLFNNHRILHCVEHPKRVQKIHVHVESSKN